MNVTIEVSKEVPDYTYFRTSDCEPSVDNDTITVFDGQGSRRSWGAPQVTSTIVYESNDFVSIHIGFSHKHRGGQFWRHYSVNGEVKQVGWGKLDDSLRAEILEGYEAKAPGWAKAPGKLRKDYIKPQQVKMTTYKAVALDGGRMVSLYDGWTEYKLGERLVQAVDRRAGVDWWGDVVHGGGWYSHPSIKRIKELLDDGNLVSARCLDGVEQIAIIECEISGRIVNFPNKKIASTYLTPVKVIETIEL